MGTFYLAFESELRSAIVYKGELNFCGEIICLSFIPEKNTISVNEFKSTNPKLLKPP